MRRAGTSAFVLALVIGGGLTGCSHPTAASASPTIQQATAEPQSTYLMSTTTTTDIPTPSDLAAPLDSPTPDVPAPDSPTPPVAGWPAAPAIPVPEQTDQPVLPQPTYYVCPTGSLLIGISVETATTVGNQIRVVVTGSAIDLASEPVLIPVPTIDGIDLTVTPTRHVVSLPGTFAGAPGQTVVEFASDQQRALTLSATMPQADFNDSTIWSLNLDTARVKYASPPTQAHSCPIRFGNEPTIIFNSFGPRSIATVQ